MKCYFCRGKPDRRLRITAHGKPVPSCRPCGRVMGHQWRSFRKEKAKHE